MISDVFWSVVAFDVLGGVLFEVLLIVQARSIFSPGRIVSFCDLGSVEDGRLIDSVVMLEFKVSVCC